MAGDGERGVGETGGGDDGVGNGGSGDRNNPVRNIFDAAKDFVDPDPGDGGNTAGGGDGDAGSGRRRRGRKPGTKNRAKAIDLSGLEKLLLSLHAGMAYAFATPELALDESEAHNLGDAMARVFRHYPMLDKISEKGLDHANLVAQLSMIYGSRFVAINLRRKTEAAKPASATVTPLRPMPLA